MKRLLFVILSTLCFAFPSFAFEGLEDGMQILHPGSSNRSEASVMTIHLNPSRQDSVQEVEIRYEQVRPGMRFLVSPGTILFHGTLDRFGRMNGTAYSFKTGCPPAGYHVTGNVIEYGRQIVLRGAAPQWQGCNVVNYVYNHNSTLQFFYGTE